MAKVHRRDDLDIDREQRRQARRGWFGRALARGGQQFRADVALRSGNVNGALDALERNPTGRVLLGDLAVTAAGVEQRSMGTTLAHIPHGAADVRVELSPTSRTGGIGVRVPIGPIGPIEVGVGRGIIRSNLYLVITDERGVEWRREFLGKQAEEVHRFAALINMAAARRTR